MTSKRLLNIKTRILSTFVLFPAALAVLIAGVGTLTTSILKPGPYKITAVDK
jgi:hypothetical protein